MAYNVEKGMTPRRTIPMAWTEHLPPTFLEEVRSAFANYPAVLADLSPERTPHDLSIAFEANMNEPAVWTSATHFVAAADARGVLTILKEAREAAKREALAKRWIEEIMPSIPRSEL